MAGALATPMSALQYSQQYNKPMPPAPRGYTYDAQGNLTKLQAFINQPGSSEHYLPGVGTGPQGQDVMDYDGPPLVQSGTGLPIGGGGGSRSSSAGAGSGGNPTALSALLSAVNGIGSYTPVAPPAASNPDVSAFNPAAEAAAYGAAKERAGQSSRSALTALTEQMANRGITGSGIQADESRKILQGGASDVADTDRAFIEQEAQNQYNFDAAKAARGEQEREFDTNAAINQNQFGYNSQLDRLKTLMQIYGQFGTVY